MVEIVRSKDFQTKETQRPSNHGQIYKNNFKILNLITNLLIPLKSLSNYMKLEIKIWKLYQVCPKFESKFTYSSCDICVISLYIFIYKILYLGSLRLPKILIEVLFRIILGSFLCRQMDNKKFAILYLFRVGLSKGQKCPKRCSI